MKKWLLIVTFSLFASGCLQTENSSSDDALATGTPQFIAAATLMSQKCTSCHFHNFHTQTADELIAQGYVVPGDLENSPIYYRLTGSTGGPPSEDKDMPTDGALSSDEIAIIVTWINSL